MSLPVSVPYAFANATTTQNLSSLDANFNALANGLNGLANGSSQISVSSISATGTANSNTYLRGDGAWATVSGGGGGNGTVTSIDVNGGTTGLTTTGGPVTTSGNITLSGTLVVSNGGTGLANITLNSVVLGNNTNSVKLVAPGTSGNALVSDGTTWTSSAVTPAAPSSVGVVGSYAFLYKATAYTAGSTYAGSLLLYSNSGASGSGNPSGTWRAMGTDLSGPSASVFVRIV